MKIRVKENTITVLDNLKDLWLLRGNTILVIKDFKYEVEKPKPVHEELNVVVRKKRFGSKSDISEKIYLTDIKIEGYHDDLKFIGIFNEEYCTRLIEAHDDPYYTLNLIDFRKAWRNLEEQINAFTKKKHEEMREEMREFMKNEKSE